MRDKTSTDVFMGAYHGLRHADDDFYPLLIGLQILGGKGFDARLMQEVRERRGLTYGAFAALRGTKHGYDGYWYAWSTFAPELLHDGLAVMRDEIQRLVRDGVSQQEVSDKITSMTGQYTVGLANTSGIAYTLRTNAEEGYAIDEIDRFPSRLAAVTAEQVNAALQRHIDPDMLITVVSGAVNDYKQPLHCNE
jgi:predicted Zn-dependent peptidase